MSHIKCRPIDSGSGSIRWASLEDIAYSLSLYLALSLGLLVVQLLAWTRRPVSLTLSYAYWIQNAGREQICQFDSDLYG